MSASHVTDHVARAIARLRQVFKDKPNIEAWLTVLVTPIQTVEDTLWALLTERGIDTAVGVQLDRIGKIVGQPRNGRVDDVYRRFIRARVSTNKSNGTAEDVLTVARLVLDDDDIGLVLEKHGPATVRLTLTDKAVSDETAELLVTYFLRRVVAAGVRLVVESSIAAPAATWHWDSADLWDDTKPWATAKD